MRKKKKEERRKKLKIESLKKKSIIIKIIYIFITICIIYHALFLISTFITKKDYFNIGNIGLIIVKEDSMKKTINKNDLVIINKKIDNLKENDIVAINENNINNNNSKNSITTISRIYQIDESNRVIFVKGDNNLHPRNDGFRKENIEGKMYARIPLLGLLINVLQNRIFTVIIIILLVFKFKINKELKQKSIKAFKKRNDEFKNI